MRTEPAVLPLTPRVLRLAQQALGSDDDDALLRLLFRHHVPRPSPDPAGDGLTIKQRKRRQSAPLHRADAASYRLSGFRLSAEALAILDAWLAWFFTGAVAEDGDLLAAHTTLRELFGDG